MHQHMPAAAQETIANWKALEERNAAVRKVDAAAALVKALQQQVRLCPPPSAWPGRNLCLSF
jgi:hypothetical protein